MSYWTITFPGTADYLREVRRFTARMLRDVAGTADVVQVASELAANAVLHTASGQPEGTFTLHLATFANRWKVRVDDEGSTTTPHVLPVGGDDIPAGGGLAIVAGLSSAWGVLGDENRRAVWAEMPFPSKARHG